MRWFTRILQVTPKFNQNGRYLIMKDTINQVQKGMTKLQEIIEDMTESRKQWRAQEQAQNEREKVLLNMMKEGKLV